MNDAVEDITTPLESWGMIHRSRARIFEVHNKEDVLNALAKAKAAGVSLGLRGGGNSYGDAPLNSEEAVLDFSTMNRILSWDAATGITTVEPGVTIGELWRHVIGDGYWPAVVPGTMKVTVGGACAMDIHGKNHFTAGSFRDHVQSFKFLTPAGDELSCSLEENVDLFRDAIGSLGLLGVFSEITLKLKKVSSGRVQVQPIAVESFSQMVDVFDELGPQSDYLVGWHDGLVTGDKLGRGLIHRGLHPPKGEDPQAGTYCHADAQKLPTRLFGIFPKSWMWLGLWFFLNKWGMRFVNAAKFSSGKRSARKGMHYQALAAFHFLLDYVPGWKKSYRPGGLIQFQSFIPKEHAARVFAELITCSHRHGHPPYLVVTKRHYETDSLIAYSVDGFSQALDIRVTKKNKAQITAMIRAMEDIVFSAGGRFYLAKDGMMTPESFRRFVAPERLESFLLLKKKLDPQNLLQSDLARRLNIL